MPSHRFWSLAVPLLFVVSAGALAQVPADQLMPGASARMLPGHVMTFVARPASGESFALPGPVADPIAGGAALEVFDTVAHPRGGISFVLPPDPGRWKGLGKPAGAKGYVYHGAGTPEDPCRVVAIKPASIKAVCKGAAVDLTLPVSGDLGIRLSVGTTPLRYCARFGGTAKGNPATAFIRKGAPPPPACPENPATAPATPTASITASATPFDTPTQTASPTESASPTMSATVTGTPEDTATATPPAPDTPTPTATPTETATPDPRVIVVSNFRIFNILRDSATITWTTNYATTTQLRISTQNGPFVDGVEDPTPVTSHTVQLVGLSANTLYTVVGVSRIPDNPANAGESLPTSFRTLR